MPTTRGELFRRYTRQENDLEQQLANVRNIPPSHQDAGYKSEVRRLEEELQGARMRSQSAQMELRHKGDGEVPDPSEVTMKIEEEVEQGPAVYGDPVTPVDPETREWAKASTHYSDAPAVEPDVPGLDTSEAASALEGTPAQQPQTEAELEEVAGRMSDEHPITKALRGHLRPAPSRESYDVDQAEGERTPAPDSAVNVSYTPPPPAKGGDIAPLTADDMAPGEMVGDLPADTSGLKMPAWKPEVVLPPRERLTADGTHKKVIDGGINFRGNDRADAIGQPAAKGGSIAPETPDDMLGGPPKDAVAPTLDLRLPPWTILQHRIWKAVSSWKMPTRIAAVAVPVVGLAVVAASVISGGGAPQAAATPAAAAVPTPLVAQQPAARTPQAAKTASPVGAQREVYVYVRLASNTVTGTPRTGCPAAGTVEHRDLQYLRVANPAPGNTNDYPLERWTHVRCGGTSYGLADRPTELPGGADPVPASPAPGQVTVPFRSPLFEPDTTFEFVNTEPTCAGTTCTHEMLLRVRNRARP